MHCQIESAESNPKCALKLLLESNNLNPQISVISGDEGYINRLNNFSISLKLFNELKEMVRFIGVTQNFKEVVNYFKLPDGETPAGFRIGLVMEPEGILRVDLIRDIAYDKNGIKRPTNVLFSADSANPYEVEPIKYLIANLTCNPGIIYDLFINNPKANIDKRFKTRDEVLEEIGKILGPGVDISVELNDPFGASDQQILEEAARFREMLSKYRVVIKVPHTGPVNSGNIDELLSGAGKFQTRYNEGTIKDMFRGHYLAHLLHENGYRVNFTLMFEPYQTALALQARPYFINSFIRHRNAQSWQIKSLLQAYEVYHDDTFLKQLRSYMIEKDYFSAKEGNIDLLKVYETAEALLKYRKVDLQDGMDGLDSVRHNLRMLRQANLPDTRLIICSMEGERNYPDIDKLLTETEFIDMTDRVVITAEPGYLSQFTSCNQVVSYQRRFMNAAKGQK